MIPEAGEGSAPSNAAWSALLRVGVFALIAIVILSFLPVILNPLGGYLIAAALGTFAAAAIANALALRIFERGQLTAVGLGWTAASRRNLVIGLVGGIGAGFCVLVLPILARAADIEPVPNEHTQWGSLVFVSIILLFGAVGEELLFRGYGFQVLARWLGPFATILPAAGLFAAAHLNNENFSWLAFVNTMLWGVVLGYAMVRSGDLWLPIGLHFGWNWTMPLLGVNLSGFTMGLTGYTLHWKVGTLWSGGSYGPEGGVLTCVVVVPLFWFLLKAPVQHQQSLLDEPAPE